jgi:hypothetical protein
LSGKDKQTGKSGVLSSGVWYEVGFGPFELSACFTVWFCLLVMDYLQASLVQKNTAPQEQAKPGSLANTSHCSHLWMFAIQNSMFRDQYG